MSNSSIVGQLRVILGLDLAEFRKNASAAQKEMRKLGRDLSTIGDNISDIGKKLSMSITAPITAAGVAVVKMAGDFEAAMNQVAISTQASSTEMKAMNDLALDLGKSTVFSASEAAGAMDALAKAGLSARQILNGAAKAAIDLAAATGSELEPAAAAITDAMSNFKMTTGDLPLVIDQITGAVNQSKFDFTDFQYAMGSAGGVAGKVGVSFKDFAAVLAGTSSSFSSGQDAGTSFKTMLIALGNPSKKAAAVIKEFGLSFYDAAGQLRPMRDIAEQLQEKFAHLSDEARTSAMADLFGSDAMRSGLALMSLGAEGLDRITVAIEKADAAAQSAKRMAGFNAQLEQLKGSIETLAIRIGQSGILEVVTSIVKAMGEFVDRLSEASPSTLKFASIVAVIAAAVGPVVVVIGTLISSIGTIATAIAPLLPVVSGGLVAALGAAAAAAAPFIAAGVAIYAMWDKIGPVLAELGKRFMDAIGPRVMGAVSAIGQALSELWSGPLGTLLRPVIALLGELTKVLLLVFGHTVISVIAGFLELVKGVFTYIADAVRIAQKLLTGDFAGAWEATKTMVANVVKSFVAILEAIVPGITTWISKIYTSAKEWLQDKLGAVFNWLRDKVREVGDYFYQLWDRVVGHSYVPDMVDGIGQEMARLQQVMVEPAKKATQSTADAFRKLAQDVAPLLDRLFPTEAAIAGIGKDLQKLDEALAAKLISPEVWAKARQRLEAELAKLRQKATDERAAELGIWTSEEAQAAIDELGTAVADAGRVVKDRYGEVEAANDNLKQSFADTFRDIVGSIQGFVDNIRNGDWLSAIQNVIDLVTQVMGLIKGSGSPKLSIPAATPKIPGFKTGGSFKVGGAAGIDRNLVQFRATAGEMVHVTKGNGGTERQDRIIIEPSPYFDARAARAAEPSIQQMGVRAAAGGSRMAETRAAKRSRRVLR